MWLDMWTAATWIPRVLDAVGCSPSSPFYSTSALFLENSLYAADVDASPSMLNVFRLLFSAWRIKKRAESRVSSFTVRYENWWLLTCIWEVNFCQIKIICLLCRICFKFYNFCLQFCPSSVGLHFKSKFSRSSIQASVRGAVMVIRQSALFSSRDVTQPAAFCRLVDG